MSTTLGEKNTIIKSYPAELDKLYDMLKFIKGYAVSIGFTGPQSLKIEVAMEEAIVNIISYGYPGDQKGVIEVSCGVLSPPAIRIVLKDQGVAYNPIASPSKAVDSDKIGGYGVKLIKEIMDEVTYNRRSGCNLLTLVKFKLDT